MLSIQVLGRGLIPRGHGIAPKKAPFPADLTLIQLILRTPGLSINYINPKTKKLSPLTNENLTEVWNRFSDYKETKPSQNQVSKPVVPEIVKQEAAAAPKVEEKKEETPAPAVETVVEETAEAVTTEETTDEEKKDEDDIIKPVLSDEKPNGGNNNYNNYNKKKHNH